jgi:outer membrane protein TolC
MRARRLAFFLLFWSSSASAEPPALTLSWALKVAREANPEVRALAAEGAAAWERVPQARALEDPSLAVQLWGFPFTRKPGQGSMVMVQLSQPLPFPGKRALRGEVAAASARVAGERVRMRQVDLEAEVKRLYYQLWVNRASREIGRRNQGLLEQLRAAALARVTTSSSTVADVLRIETEQARLRAELANIRRDREVIEAALNVRLGRAPAAPLGEPVEHFPRPPSSSYAALVAAAERQRPDLRAAGVEAQRAERQTALARRSRFPDVTPMVMFMQDIEMGPSWGATLGVTIPVWSGDKQGRALREAAQMAIAAQERQRAVRLEIERQVREARATVESAGERERLLRAQVMPRARAALEALRSDYVSGREGLTALLDGRRVLQDLDLELARARAEAALAQAELERAVGGALPP